MSTPSGGGGATDSRSPEYLMPVPPAVVIWRNVPGGESCYGVVTKINRYSIALALFAPDSRVLTPKDGVRHVGDPWNAKNGINPDSGVWDFTDESKLAQEFKEFLAKSTKAK